MARVTKPRVQHNTPKKNRLIGRVLANERLVDAAFSEGIPYGTAKNLLAKFRATGSVSNRPRSGRPKKTTDRDRRSIINNATQNRRKSMQTLTNESPVQLSKRTIRRILKEAGFRRCFARRKHWLRPEHRKALLEWALYRKGFGIIDFLSIIFSDECYICLDDKGRRIFVTRQPEEEYDEEWLAPTFKQSSVRVMVWGCIIAGRKGPLVVLEYPGGPGGGMTAERYQEQVLEAALKPSFEKMKKVNSLVAFQQDGAPSHTAKSTLQWLEEAGIPTVEHPASSPDLNAIECCWPLIKEIIRSGPLPTSTDTLKSAVRAAWDALPQDQIDKQIFSMPKRVQAVIEANGGPTRY